MSNMKRLVFLSFIFIILNGQWSMVNGENISDVFTAMPDSIFPLLTAKNRHDMVDFYKNKMEAKVRNRLGDYALLFDFVKRLNGDSNLRFTLTVDPE